MNRAAKIFVAAAFTAGAVAGPQTAAAQSYLFPGPGESIIGYADDLFVTSQEVFIQYIGYEAAYEDVLSFWVGSPWAGGTQYTIVNNQKTATPGAVLRLNDFVGGGYMFTPGDRIYFSIYVADEGWWTNHDPDDIGKTYYTAHPSTNPDGLHHSQIATYTGSGSYGGMAVNFNRQIGFEDILQDNDQPNPDWDFDDVVFATKGVEVTPEPVTLLLMATGLVGVAGVAYRRRRQDGGADA